MVSTMAEIARGRALEAERPRGEADLAATLARELLSGEQTETALGATSRRVAEALAIPSARIELGAAEGCQQRVTIPLQGEYCWFVAAQARRLDLRLLHRPDC